LVDTTGAGGLDVAMNSLADMRESIAAGLVQGGALASVSVVRSCNPSHINGEMNCLLSAPATPRWALCMDRPPTGYILQSTHATNQLTGCSWKVVRHLVLLHASRNYSLADPLEAIPLVHRRRRLQPQPYTRDKPLAMSVPALPPPINPEDLGRGPLVMGVAWSFSGLALITVGMRFWVRIAVTKQLKIEDWLMLLAVVDTSLFHDS
jgi:hypothetical protein